MKRTALPTARLVASALLALALCACESTTTRTVAGAPEPGTSISPRVAVEAPADLHDISGALLRYRVLHQSLPDTLGVLRDEGFLPAEGYDGLGSYAYQPDGLGRLSDGRTIFVVDTAIRVEGHAWCILAEPSGNPRTAALMVSLVSMADLQAAARRSR
jgi:hypothetical protein